jgi:hypothetical protein
MMKSVWSSPGTSETVKPDLRSVFIAVPGTTSMASRLLCLSAVTIASSFENCCRPNSSIFGFGPQ